MVNVSVSRLRVWVRSRLSDPSGSRVRAGVGRGPKVRSRLGAGVGSVPRSGWRVKVGIEGVRVSGSVRASPCPSRSGLVGRFKSRPRSESIGSGPGESRDQSWSVQASGGITGLFLRAWNEVRSGCEVVVGVYSGSEDRVKTSLRTQVRAGIRVGRVQAGGV